MTDLAIIVEDGLLATGGELMPTPVTPDARSAARHTTTTGVMNSGTSLTDAVRMLPTPRATDGTKGGPNMRGSSGDLMLPSAVLRLDSDTEFKVLPTPTSRDCKGVSGRSPVRKCGRVRTEADGGGGPNDPIARIEKGHQVQPIDLGMRADIWGRYAPAIARWEYLTRPAPAPTEPSKRGKYGARLSAKFSEWLMGWPAGWVTDVEGLSRSTQLKLIGNGVVVQQCEAALRILLQDWEGDDDPQEGLFDAQDLFSTDPKADPQTGQ